MSYINIDELYAFLKVCDDGALCDALYCPYAAGHTGRFGPCEGDFCEEAWEAYCEANEIEWER